jgi:hypothetical protein
MGPPHLFKVLNSPTLYHRKGKEEGRQIKYLSPFPVKKKKEKYKKEKYG